MKERKTGKETVKSLNERAELIIQLIEEHYFEQNEETLDSKLTEEQKISRDKERELAKNFSDLLELWPKETIRAFFDMLHLKHISMQAIGDGDSFILSNIGAFNQIDTNFLEKIIDICDENSILDYIDNAVGDEE